MDKVAIMGLGLMGGSLGLALKSVGFQGTLAGYARRAETRSVALEAGMIDTAHDDPVSAVQDADLVVYCTPILTIPDLVAASRQGLKPGALLTDVGSTKKELAQLVTDALAGTAATFVGSHPVAGSEQQGVEAARADLYEGALVVVTPEQADAEPTAVAAVVEFWQQIGARVRVIDAATHDALMARTSHLPHLIASLLAVTVGREDAAAEVGPYCGTGFRDTSRVADGSPDVWHDIVCSNAPAIGEELKQYRAQLDQLIAWTDARDFDRIKGYLAAGRAARRALLNTQSME